MADALFDSVWLSHDHVTHADRLENPMADKPDAHADVHSTALPGQHSGAPTPTPATGEGSLAPNVRPVVPVSPTLRSAQPPVQARTATQPQTTAPDTAPSPTIDPLEQSLLDLRGKLAAVQGLPQYAAEQDALRSQIFQTEQALNARRG